MKWLRKEGTSEWNVPMLLLLAVGVIEFLFISLESLFSGISYYLAETYLIVPCLLFLSYVLREKQSTFSRRRLMLAVAAASWFVIVQCIHKLQGMENHPMATVFSVYLIAFPFAALTDDRENKGFWWIGSMFVTASLVLVFYTVLLVTGLVPAGLKAHLFWDGARLHAMWHPNINACYFMIGIGFSAAFCGRTGKLWQKSLWLLAIAVQFLAMTLTNCRTVLLMTGALMGGIVFFRIFRGSWKQFVLGLAAAAVLLVGSFKLSGMIFQWNNARLLASFSVAQVEVPAAQAPSEENAASAEETPSETETTSAEETLSEEEAPAEEEVSSGKTGAVVEESTGVLVGENWQGTLAHDMRTLNGRTRIWKSALAAIRDSKALALWGTEYSGTLISVYNPFPVVHAHNSWMEVLMRMGLPGLALSLVFTAIAIFSAAKLALNMQTELWKKTIAITTMCILLAGFLEPYLFITNVYYHVTDFMFFFLTGYLDLWANRAK